MNGPKTIFVWLLIGCLGSLILGWRDLISWADKNPNMAAWVQAIGSVLAILAAAVIAYYQGWQQLKTTREQAHARQRNLEKTLIHLVRQLGYVGRIAAEGEEPRIEARLLPIAAIQEACSTLQEIPLWEIDKPQIISPVLALTRSIRIAVTGLAHGIEIKHTGQSILDSCNGFLAVLGESPVPLLTGKSLKNAAGQLNPHRE